MELKDFKTCELVEELKKREGVEYKWVDPYAKETIEVEGGIVLIVID
ncbi:MAG: BC1881 family protein [Paraclostridium sp.]